MYIYIHIHNYICVYIDLHELFLTRKLSACQTDNVSGTDLTNRLNLLPASCRSL